MYFLLQTDKIKKIIKINIAANDSIQRLKMAYMKFYRIFQISPNLLLKSIYTELQERNKY